MAKLMKGVTSERQEKWYNEHQKSIDNDIYRPFLRVEDVKSYGVKGKIRSLDKPHRVVHLLSLNEQLMYFYLANKTSILKCYEQFALPLNETVAIASELDVKHPVYSDTRIPIHQTIDFLCYNANEQRVAYAVKESSALENYRTLEKLAIQESWCRINGVDFHIYESDTLKTERFFNLERLHKHAILDEIYSSLYDIWLINFIGILSDDRHDRLAHIIEKSATVSGIEYARAVHFVYHSFWVKKLLYDECKPLLLDEAASDLGIFPNDKY